MPEDELLRTPLNELMHKYTTNSKGPSTRNCERDFGVGLIERWRSTAKTCCNGGDSKLTCHLVQQTKHHGNGDQLLLADNVMINFKVRLAHSHNMSLLPQPLVFKLPSTAPACAQLS